jgi:hypothetical protein
VVGPVYKGTLSTMRDIVKQEGITVRLFFLVAMASRLSTGPSDHIAEAEPANDFLVIGSMERQHTRRDDVCLLRSPSIHRIPSYDPSTGAIGSLPTPAIRRILRLRCRSRRNRDGDNIPARPTSHTLCCPGTRTDLSIAGIVSARDCATRGSRRVLPGMLSGRRPDCTIYGIVFHRIRRVPSYDGPVGFFTVRDW